MQDVEAVTYTVVVSVIQVNGVLNLQKMSLAPQFSTWTRTPPEIASTQGIQAQTMGRISCGRDGTLCLVQTLQTSKSFNHANECVLKCP